MSGTGVREVELLVLILSMEVVKLETMLGMSVGENWELLENDEACKGGKNTPQRSFVSIIENSNWMERAGCWIPRIG